MSGMHQGLVSTLVDPRSVSPRQTIESNAREAPAKRLPGCLGDKKGELELCFKVPEMTDGDGAKAITDQVRPIEGISGVEIDLHTKWVVITGERIDTEAIHRAVRQTGYDAEL
jgi:copper chaperone CopZ